MKESTLFKFALAVSLIGILALLIIVENIEVPLIKISSVDNSKEEDIIKIKGNIEGIKETPGLYILKVKDESETIDVIVFKENGLNFTKNSLVEIEGTIQEYQGKKELVAKEILR